MQFKTLLKKDFILWRRNIVGSIFEILVPLIFVALLVYVGTLTEDTVINTSNSDLIPFPTTSSLFNGLPEKELKNMFKNCANPDFRKGGRIAIYPNKPFTNDIKPLFDKLKFETVFFDSKKEIEDVIDDSKYTEKLEGNKWNQFCLTIEFDEFENSKYAYKLRFNTTGPWPRKDHWDTVEKQPYILYTKDSQDTFENINKNGIFLLQNWIDNLIMKKETGKGLEVSATRFKINPYTISNAYDIMGFPMTLLFMIIMIFPYVRIIGQIVSEREQLVLQNMENMGMKKSNYFWATFTFYSLKSFFVQIISCLFIKLLILKKVDFFVLFFGIYLGCLVFITLGFFISCFFVNTKKAIITGIVIFFILNLGSSLLPSVADSSGAVTLLAIISPLVNLEIFKDGMLRAQSNYTPFTFSSLDSYSFNVRLYVPFLIYIFEFILFTLLSLYCFYVVPLSTGKAEHPLFCFKRKKKKLLRSESIKESKDESLQEFFEPISPEMEVQAREAKTLRLVNLKKKYGNGKVAVNDLNLEMFPDQIFSLLGHNGAGKTTTISMISGLLTQTSGNIELFGKDSLSSVNFFKSQMGVCPQKNPIFAQLTVYEHLWIYSRIKFKEKQKGDPETDKNEKFDYKKSNEEIETILKDIDLWDKKDNLAKELSGGQKRKLCVAMAFISGSKVILLDEPTSGMDTFARRHLWEMLKMYKNNRIIILTTHNMDEADFLGDRIGIMSSGGLVTVGSSMFLKNKFGVGYVLNIIKEHEDKGQQIVDKILEKVPNAFLASDYGLEMKIQMQKDDEEYFEELFQFLEQEGKDLGVKEFGISLTTLEDVFLKVGNLFDEDALDDKQIVTSMGGTNQADENLRKIINRGTSNKNIDKPKPKTLKEKDSKWDPKLEQEVEDFTLAEMKEKSTSKIWFNQVGALIKKRFLYLSRDKGGIMCEIVMPILLVLVGLGLTKIQFVMDSPDKSLIPNYLNASQFRIGDPNGGTNTLTKSIYEQIKKDQALTEQILKDANSPAKMQDHILANPVEGDIFDYFLGSDFNSANSFKYNVFYNTTFPLSPMVASNTFNNALLKQQTGKSDAYIKASLHPMKPPLGIRRIENTADSINVAILFSIAFAFIPTSIILFFIKERESNAKYQQYVSGMYKTAFWIANIIVDYSKYLIIAIVMYSFIFILDVDFLRERDGEVASLLLFLLYGFDLLIIAYVFSFAFKSTSKGQTFMFLFIYMGSFTTSILTFVLRLVNSTRKTHDDVLVWILRFLPFYDFTVSFVNMGNAGLYRVFYLWKDDPDYLDTRIALYEIIFLIIGFFVLLLILALIEIAVPIKAFFVRKRGRPLTKEIKKDIDSKKKIGQFGYQEEILNKLDDQLSNEFAYNELHSNIKNVPHESNSEIPENSNIEELKNDTERDFFAQTQDLGNESHQNKVRDLKIKQMTPDQSSRNVESERFTKDKITISNAAIELDNLYKVYKKGTGGKTMAVKGTFLKIKPGECFGLLGTNGAGKTTTFKMMCGQIAPTYGTAKVMGNNMPEGMRKVRNQMGYCPQFDALLDKLTSYEHLELFCNLKGIQKKYHKYLIESSLKNLNLNKYRNVQAGTYSGGNKRKLNVALALLAKPPIVFLDEPSSGMDPEARRFMWNIINNITNVRKSSSIVLTTHSMEEAEALTNRLAIMVDGQVKVMGPVQSIKNVYGDAFEVDFVFTSMTADQKSNLETEINNEIKDQKDYSLNEIKKLLKKKPSLYKAFKEQGDQNILKKIYEKYEGVEKGFLINWMYVTYLIHLLKQAFQDRFPKFSVIERLNLFIRLKLSSEYKLSEIFSFLKNNKDELSIDEYNVKQMSLEQIFLAFARQTLEKDKKKKKK